MNDLRAVREQDRVTLPTPRPPLDLSPFLGSWRKTNWVPPQWVERVDIREAGSNIAIRIAGGDAPSPREWGEVEARTLYASAIDSARGGGFVASFSLRGCEVDVEGNVNLGLLVLATFVRWTDGSGRADRFTREFFHRSDPA